jgi:hypothetical protein
MSKIAKFAKDVDEAADKEEIPFDPTETKDAKGDVIDISESGNQSDYKKAAALIEKIEKEQAAIDAISEQAKHDKAPHRDEITRLKNIIRDEHSIEASALRLKLKERRELRRLQAMKDALEEPAAGQFEQLEMAL